MAKTYQSFGLRKGDFLSIFSENRIEFTISMLGALFVGIVPVPINFQYMKGNCIVKTEVQIRKMKLTTQFFNVLFHAVAKFNHMITSIRAPLT